MTVETVVDDYLTAVHALLGTAPPPPGSPPPAPVPVRLPSTETNWVGGAHDAAVAASHKLEQAREHLTEIATHAATLTEASAQIAADASHQLDAIITEWSHNKAAAALLPSPSARNSALLTAGRHRINDAISLITATADKYNDAASELRAHTATLPAPNHAERAQHLHDPTNPHPDDKTPTPSTGPAFPDPPPADAPTTAAAAPEGLLQTAAGMVPTLIAPASSLPTAILPMASAIPAAAATPLASLGSITQPGNILTAAHNPTGPGNHQGVDTIRIPKNGSISADIDAALDEVGITDPQARARWHAGYQILINRESGDNIDAVNLHDSNAHGPMQPDGAPEGSSRGLTQVTPSTFRQFHAPGTSNNIYDPVANIAASIRYVIAVHHVDASGIDLAEKVPQANPNSGGGY